MIKSKDFMHHVIYRTLCITKCITKTVRNVCSLDFCSCSNLLRRQNQNFSGYPMYASR